MSWPLILKSNFTRLDLLADFLQLDDSQRERIFRFSTFPLNLPRRLAEKIKKKTLDDPLLLQFVPLMEETIETPSFELDPICEQSFRKKPKLLQKYKSRSLLLATSACAMNCRFCFRKHFPYEKETIGFEKELEVLERDETIKEVILSGGDPLSLNNRILGALIERLNKIPHVERLRFHTRFPLGIPERIDQEFLDILEKSRLQTWFIIHTNHVLELDDDVLRALKRIQKLGIPVLSQTVLLKQVNDTVEALHALFEKLVDYGISPYYLHQLDKVAGTWHFEVKEEKGKELIDSLSGLSPGYVVPRYVKEVAFRPSKTPIL